MCVTDSSLRQMRHLDRNGLAKMSPGVVLVLCIVDGCGWTYVHQPEPCSSIRCLVKTCPSVRAIPTTSCSMATAGSCWPL